MGEAGGSILGAMMAKKQGGGSTSPQGGPPGQGFFGGIASGAQGGQGSPGFLGGIGAGSAGQGVQAFQPFMPPQQAQQPILPAMVQPAPMQAAPLGNPLANNFYSNPNIMNRQDLGMLYQSLARPDPTMQGPAPPMAGVSLKNRMLSGMRSYFGDGQ